MDDEWRFAAIRVASQQRFAIAAQSILSRQIPWLRRLEKLGQVMISTDEDLHLEEPRTSRESATINPQPRAAAAHYDRKSRRITVLLSNGLQLSIPIRLARGLASEAAADLENIEISPAGLALHWPKLNADLYLPSLFDGMFGTRERRWQAFWASWGSR